MVGGVISQKMYCCVCSLFCAAPTVQIFLASAHHVCSFSVCFSCLVLSICVCMCFPSLSPFHSDLDCPVVWGSSGLLLFSCSLRYLFHCHSPLSAHHFVFISMSLTPNLAALDLKQTYFFLFAILCRYTCTLMCTHLCF